MARHRYGVALLFDPEVSFEIRGLRRAFGAHQRMEPHITLVPPINLHDHQLDQAMASLRTVGASLARQLTGPLDVTIGPAASFDPVSPVLYLQVSGTEAMMAALTDTQAALHERVPFDRPPKFSYVPHVSIHEDCPSDRIQVGLEALRSFSIDTHIDRMWLLRDNPEQDQWERVADVTFEQPAIRGNGGIALSFRISSRPAAGLFAAELARQSKLVIEASDHGKVVGALMDNHRETHLWIAEGYERLGIDDRMYTEHSRVLLERGDDLIER